MKRNTKTIKLALASGFALSLVSGAGAAADLTRSFAVGVNACDNAVQLCTPIPIVALPTQGVLRVEFDASPTHCSSMIAHLLVDGVEQFASGVLAPGEGTGEQDFGAIAAGVHQVGVQAEGVLGGCNPGSVALWSGTLSLTVSGVTEADAAIAAPGESVSISTVVGGSPAPAAIEASYTRPIGAVGLATLSGVTYLPSEPHIPGEPALPIGSFAFVDLLLLGGGAADELQARFLPGDPYSPPNPNAPPDLVIPIEPYRLAFWDGAAWLPVLGSDGAPPPFTTASGFSASFTATSAPQVTALGGTVFAFVASYGLVGFEPPVDNDAVNVAKAGRAIPLKWGLYDLGGNPITDLAAVHVTSVSLSCSALTEGQDPVEEYATGASGLQNHGDGQYQLNWATAKTFAGTCRRLRLDLGERNPDGTVFYRTADFRFTK